jgi:hypothetical protein
MTFPATNQATETGRRVRLLLTSPRVTSAFRDALLAAASAADQTPGEFALQAAADKLRAVGVRFPGVFRPDDLGHHNDNRRG